MEDRSIHLAAPCPWPPVESFVVDSARLGRKLQISLAGKAHDADGGTTTVVYLLDPSFNLMAASTIVAFLESFASLAGSKFPSVVIAGIGYEAQDPRQVMALRARDLTPTAEPGEAVSLPPLQFGGAATFLSALTEEVVAAVERRLGAGKVTRVLAGHSFGGLFALFALLRQPDAFAGYIALSPSLWWNDRIVLREAMAWQPVAVARRVPVFLAVGEKEQAAGGGWRNENFPDESIRRLRQVENFRELVAILAAPEKQLTLDSVVLADEYHLTVFPAVFGRALRFVMDRLA
ncbi:MAG TPA: alpha/beta fold hydrolase [Burkholderiales bacterium]|nr:alpha/beta fold hydrolase [Burkholderiales bacterium]